MHSSASEMDEGHNNSNYRRKSYEY